MKYLPSTKAIDNEDGFVLVAAMMILMILVVIGIAATNSTNVENQIAVNDRIAKEDFYNQETCIGNGKFQFRTWLTPNFTNTADILSFFPPPAAGPLEDVNNNGINDASECVDPNGLVIGAFRVRKDESTGTPINNWEDLADFGGVAANHPANAFPPKDHVDKPDPGSGDDPKNFEIRRYIMTSYSPDNTRQVIIQEGVYKTFNKF